MGEALVLGFDYFLFLRGLGNFVGRGIMSRVHVFLGAWVEADSSAADC